MWAELNLNIWSFVDKISNDIEIEHREINILSQKNIKK